MVFAYWPNSDNRETTEKLIVYVVHVIASNNRSSNNVVLVIREHDGLTENAGHEIAGHENARHEFAIHGKYRMKIYHITVQCAFLLNFKSCMYSECVNVENLTAPAHHKYSSVL